MPKLEVLDMTGKEVDKVDLSESIFGIKPNTHVMHQMVVNYLANKRQGTQSTLTRAEVSGGGKKPWRQKGTGRARQGSTRSPQWVHGGLAFAPKPRDYSFSVNKKVKRLAIKSALSSKLQSDDLIILDKINLNKFSTKTIVNMLDDLDVSNRILLVLKNADEKVIKSSNNIQGLKTVDVNNINVYEILKAKKIVILKEAARQLEEVYSK